MKRFIATLLLLSMLIVPSALAAGNIAGENQLEDGLETVDTNDIDSIIGDQMVQTSDDCSEYISSVVNYEWTGTVSETDVDNIIYALYSSEGFKDILGLESVNFSELQIGNVINLYEYKENICEQINIMYPLSINGKIVAFAVKLGESTFNISTQLVQELSSFMDYTTEISIIYDKDSCYLFDGVSVQKLVDSSIVDTTRGDITECTTFSNIELCDLSEVFPLSDTNVQNYAIIDTYYCDIQPVLQPKNSNICWAATAACISNCINKTNYDAIDVAKLYYGSDFNKGIPVAEIKTMLEYFNLYFWGLSEVNASVIRSNIIAQFPVYGTFVVDGQSTTHDCVIYGTNSSVDKLAVMDPSSGCLVASAVGDNFAYFSSISGRIVALWRIHHYLRH